MTLHVAILGSGNIGTDLMYKVDQEPGARAGRGGRDRPASEGLARARGSGSPRPTDGAEALPGRAPGVDAGFDATSAHAHVEHAPLLAAAGIRCIDLTPAALGPAVVPDVNLDEHLDAPKSTWSRCGAQATVPFVARCRPRATGRVRARSSRRSRRGRPARDAPEHRRVHDATAAFAGDAGWRREGKAIIILNPAEPPIMMRNTRLRRDRRDRGRDGGGGRPRRGGPGGRLRARLSPGHRAARVRRRCSRPSSRWRAPATTCRASPGTSTS